MMDKRMKSSHIAAPKKLLGWSIWKRIALFNLMVLTLAEIAPGQTSKQDLTTLNLEDLMNIEVTSVSKKDQRLSRVASAISVITQDDIRHSGATNIPDLLRTVPGLDVAQINANSWAISARGFNHQFSDKLLVLIDGRTVYTPLFAGVYWDTQDVPLEDIERIEVIRGPGATVWGANAVNGVINIITKSAAETQGGLLVAGGGTQDSALGLAQYGGKIGNDVSYRVFTKYLDHNYFPDLTGQNGEDGWHLAHAGFRTDASLTQKDSLTVEGDLYGGSEGANYGHIVSIAPPVNVNIDGSEQIPGGNILGRWNHVFSSRSDTTLQFYFDRFERDGGEISEKRNTFDLDFQHHLALGARHDLIWGADFRNSSDYTEGTIDRAWVPAGRTLQLFSTFAQDEIVLKPDRVFLTVGTKLEKNYYTSWDVDPSARVAWTPSKQHSFWAAVSRASRTPSRREEDADINIAAFSGPGEEPALLTLLGNPDEKSEHVVAYEAGYRAQPAGPFSIDVATFFNSYTDLATAEPGSPFLVANPAPSHLVFPLVWGNKMHGTTDGIEMSANWKVTDRWTLSPGYALLQMHLHTDPTSQDTASVANTEGSSPRHQAQFRSHLKLPGRFVWDVSGYFVERLPAQAVPSYTRIDTQLSRQLGERLEFSLVGQNLLRDHHLESNDALTSVTPTQIKRSAYVKITWHFW
jgi:iron complex outermembrane receptor protein